MPSKLTRKSRVNFIKNMVLEADLRDDTLEEIKLIAVVCNRFGATKRTVTEYIDELELIDYVTRDGGLIWLKKWLKHKKPI